MKIPKQAKKVFTGEIFDVYQWPQKMFDGSYATFEMISRQHTIEVIPVMDNKVVLIYEQQPTLPAKYSVIGGRQEDGETSLKAAKRELLEETGLVSNDWELVKKFYPYNKMDWVISRYIARNCKKVSEQKLDSGEKIILKPVNFSEFMDIIVDENFHSIDVTTDVLRMEHNGKLTKFKQKLFKKIK